MGIPKGQAPIQIRRARPGDAARLAILAGQLGYPTTRREMVQRLRRVLREKRGVCFVATKQVDNEIVGWMHVSTSPLLEVEFRAEINGLVVDEHVRSQGAGALLLGAAEKWAKRAGAKSMSVRSNILRERAHSFYERNGYEHYKTQKAFRKKL